MLVFALGYSPAQRKVVLQKRKSPWLIKLLIILSIPILLLKWFVYDIFAIPSGSMLPTVSPGNHVLVSTWGSGKLRFLRQTVYQYPASVELKRGDIIVFEYPADPSIDYIKRIVGMPGEVIRVHNRHVWIGKDCPDGVDQCQLTPLKRVEKQTGITDDNLPGTATRYTETNEHGQYDILMLDQGRDFAHMFYKQVNQLSGQWIVPEGHYFVMGDNRDNARDSRFWGFVPQENLVGVLKAVF